MRALIYILMLGSITRVVQAQSKSVLRGYVTIQNTGKALYPATIRSDDASDGHTDSRTGEFWLIYNSKVPGSDVEIKVLTTGNIKYEVVPQRSCYARIPNNVDVDSPLHLVVCVQGAWERNRDQWIVKSSRVIMQEYAQMIAALDRRDVRAYEVEKMKLIGQRDSAIQNSKVVIEELAITDLTRASPRYRQAVDLFAQNKTRKAIQLLDEDKAEADIRNADARKSNAIDELLLKAKFYWTLPDWTNAVRLYKRAVEADTTNYKRSLEAARFHMAVNDNGYAIAVYSRIARFAPTTADSVNTRRMLAGAYYAHGEIAVAERIFHEVLDFCHRAIVMDSARYSEMLGLTLYNLAIIAERHISHKEATDYLVEAYHIYDRLDAKDPEYRSHIFAIMGELSNVLVETNDYQLAGECVRTALNASLHRPGSDTSNAALYDLASVYGMMASVYDHLPGKKDSVEPCYKESIKLFRRIGARLPYGLLENFSTSLANYSSFLVKNDRRNLALTYLNEALILDKKMAFNDSLAALPLMADHYTKVAIFYQGNSDSVWKYVNTSLDIRRRLAGTDTLSFGAPYAKALLNISRVLLEKNLARAIDSSRKALMIYLSLARKEGGYREDLASSTEHLAILCYSNRDYRQSVDLFMQAIILYKPLLRGQPDLYLDKILTTYNVACDGARESLCQTADVSILEDGKKMADEMGRCLDTVKNEDIKQRYTRQALSYRTFFSTVDAADARWLKLVEEAKSLADSVQQAGDTLERKNFQRLLGVKVVQAMETTVDKPAIAGFLFTDYHSLSWSSLFANRPDLAQKAVERGLVLVPTDEFILTNLALAYLYQDNWEQAKQIYLRFKGKLTQDGRKWNDIFLKDLDDLQHVGLPSSHYMEVRSLLLN